MQGFLNVFKPSGISSAKVVSDVKKVCNGSKVGHMGTLDPMACGVLPIAVGKATRMFNYFLNKYKTYRAVFEFGYETDTLDALGSIVKNNGLIPSIEQIKNTTAEFLGKIMQTPPSYSAKNVNGTRAYKLARKGEVVQLAPKEVEIKTFVLTKQINSTSFEFLIECGSGTYIRSLGRDLGYALNTFATMTYLQRETTGAFKLENAHNVEEITSENIKDMLLPIEKVFTQYPIVVVNESDGTKLLNGLAIKYKHVTSANEVFVKHNNELLGLAKIENNLLKLSVYLLEN